METKLEGITAKALKEPNLVFTSLAHHVTKSLLWDGLKHMNKNTASGVDGINVDTAEKDFNLWADEMITSIYRRSYKPPTVRRVWIPKPGKIREKPHRSPLCCRSSTTKKCSNSTKCNI